jgi:predicted Rossmann fold nucleotide-binding protein DprA/Smf involved in DNA uptake
VLTYEERHGLRAQIDKAKRMRMGIVGTAETEQAVLAVLGTEWVAVGVVAARLGITRQRAATALGRLAKAGTIARAGRLHRTRQYRRPP